MHLVRSLDSLNCVTETETEPEMETETDMGRTRRWRWRRRSGSNLLRAVVADYAASGRQSRRRLQRCRDRRKIEKERDSDRERE